MNYLIFFYFPRELCGKMTPKLFRDMEVSRSDKENTCLLHISTIGQLNEPHGRTQGYNLLRSFVSVRFLSVAHVQKYVCVYEYNVLQQ